MDENTYDIIEWKSCESYSSHTLSEEGKDELYRIPRTYPFSRDEIASVTDIHFPTLFHEHESETSIVSLLGIGLDGPLHFYNANVPDQEELTVYQKVADWVFEQRKFFRKVERETIEDDDIEVIDPVDLFHESILDEYLLLTENESERRILLRDFDTHRYHIESIEQAMQTNEYKFLRKPKPFIELELTPLITFHELHKSQNVRKKKKRKLSSSTDSSCKEKEEETITFLGVPRLLENYVVFNRDGYEVKLNTDIDLWLAPMEENLICNDLGKSGSHDELEIISSWFSDVYQTDNYTDEVRTLVTVNTDMLEKVTVISVSHASEEEIWEDAPDIPHWLDEDEYEELELFNQPSKPLYYYRDRIKGCYRIIGVEDETVVLFSGNDDDTIFYPGDISAQQQLKIRTNSKNNLFENDRLPKYSRPFRATRSDSDRKNDSGIEDIDDMFSEEIAVASVSFSREDAKIFGYTTEQHIITNNNISSNYTDQNQSSLEWLVLPLGLFLFILALAAYKNDIGDVFYRIETQVKNIYDDLL